MMKDALPGRNETCWCGSGRKYKKCHMPADQVRATPVRNRPRSKSAGPLMGSADREKMRAACRFNAQLLDVLRPHVRAGVTTDELNRIAHEYTLDHGHTPACLGYKGFPRSICTSVNEVVCHGIPGPYALKPGDIVNVDVTTIVDGWHGDQSETFVIGKASDEARRLVQCAFDSLYLAIRAIKPYSRVVEIGRAISEHAQELGFSVVRDCQGHGLGRHFHQPPDVPHYVTPRAAKLVLEPGVCFTIEPMINAGKWPVVVDREDGWTIRTADGSLSAQFEHTILMTEAGPEILTLTEHGPQEGHRF